MEIRLLQASDKKQAAAMACRAFYDDPMWSYVLPKKAWRARQIEWLFEKSFQVLGPLNTCFTTPNCEGIALWFPPGQNPNLGFWQELKLGIGLMPFTFGITGIRRGMVARADIERRQHEEITEPHWVLNAIAVDPEHQGKGVGGALMNHIFARADTDNVPCHVITHNPANIPFYEKYGFTLIRKGTVFPGGPFVCSFRRLPHTPIRA
jgi:ribosomal protein S18 acetylase RimI-like enzyme